MTSSRIADISYIRPSNLLGETRHGGSKNWLLGMMAILFFFHGIERTNGQDKAVKAETLSLQNRWLNNLHTGQNQAFLFTPVSGLLYRDSLFTGAASIEGVWRKTNREDRIIRYDTLSFFRLYENQMIVHGVYTSAKGVKSSSIIAWKKDKNWSKVFEAVAPRGQSSEDSRTEIGLLRSSWELYANQHRPDLIVKNIFAPKGRYFYRGTDYRGKEIAEAYGYMRDRAYSINLTHKKIIPVNDKLIYEIGIYEAGGKGLYVLIWGREADDWKLILDFNY